MATDDDSLTVTLLTQRLKREWKKMAKCLRTTSEAFVDALFTGFTERPSKTELLLLQTRYLRLVLSKSKEKLRRRSV